MAGDEDDVAGASSQLLMRFPVHRRRTINARVDAVGNRDDAAAGARSARVGHHVARLALVARHDGFRVRIENLSPAHPAPVETRDGKRVGSAGSGRRDRRRDSTVGAIACTRPTPRARPSRTNDAARRSSPARPSQSPSGITSTSIR